MVGEGFDKVCRFGQWLCVLIPMNRQSLKTRGKEPHQKSNAGSISERTTQWQLTNNNNIQNVRIIMAYTAAFSQSGSSSAGIRVISASNIGQAASTGEIPLLFSRSVVGSLKSPVLG